MDPVVLGARAVLLASVVVLLGAAGHAGADGLLPGAGGLAALWLATAAASAVFLTRPAGARALVALTVAGQAAVHAALSAAAGHGGAAAVGAHPADPHSHAATAAAHVDTGPLSLVGLLLEHGVEHAPMMLAHAVAAALVGLWLAVGERSLWTLVALAAAVVLGPLAVLGALARAGLPVVRRAPSRAPEPSGLRRPDVLARTPARRGPPLLPA